MKILSILASVAISMHTLPAFAFPEKPIEIIVPANTGAASDTMARVLASALEQVLQTNVLVVNRAGGGGVEGMREFSSRPPDGHTVILLARSHIAQVETGDVPIDGDTFSPLNYLVTEPYIYVANSADGQFASGEALVSRMVDETSKLVVGGYGAKSASRLAHEAFRNGIGGVATWLPLASGSQVMESILGQHVEVAVTQFASALQFVEAGEASILAVSTAERLPNFPDVPTFKELGGDVTQTHWRALFVHNETDLEVRRVLEEALSQAAQDEALQTYIGNSGLGASVLTREEAEMFMTKDREIISDLLAIID